MAALVAKRAAAVAAFLAATLGLIALAAPAAAAQSLDGEHLPWPLAHTSCLASVFMRLCRLTSASLNSDAPRAAAKVGLNALAGGR